jgi:hypothetical protein
MDRDLWVVVERFALGIFVLGLTAPVIGAWVGRRIGRRWRHTLVGMGLGAGAGVVVMPFLLWLAMCTPPVGRGATAEWCYQTTTPILGSLEKFRASNGTYPDSLSSLVPAFLDANALSTARMATNGHLSYQRDGAGFTLRFDYHGPGMNHCSYASRTPHWVCGGYL